MSEPQGTLAAAHRSPVYPSVIGATAVTLLFLVTFQYRQDYAAHVSGGYALVLLVAGVLTATGLYRVWAPVWALGAAAVVAVAAELTLFGGIVDLVEVSISVLGAGLAAAVLHRFGVESVQPVAMVALGSVLLVASFMLRFEFPVVILGG